jgi:hypothetical protein
VANPAEHLDAPVELLAYCGFYCGDCLGYTGVIADAAEAFKVVLDRYQFERTAECVFPQELAEYGKLLEMVGFMTELRCPGVCRRGDPNRPSSADLGSCKIKACCIEKGYYACYECDQFEACELHRAVHEGLHYDSCIKNMRAIREMGLEAWLAGGRRYCYWNIGG